MGGKSTRDLYGTHSIEASLRDEFNGTIDGTPIEELKGQVMLLRRMRRDSNGNKIRCECTLNSTGEPDKDNLCRICLGEIYRWDEIKISGYRSLMQPKEVIMPGGLMNVPLVLFYIKYDTLVDTNDKIVELVLDKEGNPILPPQRTAIFKIQHAQQYRLDAGRIEYIKIWSYLVNTKYLNETDAH